MEVRFRRHEQPARLEPEAVSLETDTPEEPPLQSSRPGSKFLRTARAFLPVSVLGIFMIALVGFLYWSKPVSLPIVLAVLLALVLRPVVKYLARMHIPEVFGSLLVMA